MTRSGFRRRVSIMLGVGLALVAMSWLSRALHPAMLIYMPIFWVAWSCWVGISVYHRCRNARIPGWWAVAIFGMTLAVADILFGLSATVFSLGLAKARMSALTTVVPFLAMMLFLCWFDIRSERDPGNPGFRLLWPATSVCLVGVAVFNFARSSVMLALLPFVGESYFAAVIKISYPYSAINGWLPVRLEVVFPTMLVCGLIGILWKYRQNAGSDQSGR